MVRLDISNVKEIIKKDFKSTVKNPIVILILVAIVVLPSLYALLNVAACWDIYGNTEHLEFAIANLDEGAVYEGVNITVGHDLVEELKNNTDFSWNFVSEQELRDGVVEGRYAGGIVIPKNFSSSIISITTDDPHPAILHYIVNRKEDAMSPRLSDTCANFIYRDLNAKIVEFINLAAYGKLGELQAGLASGSAQLASGGSQLQAGASKISSGESQVASGVSQVSNGASSVSDGAAQIESGAARVEQVSSEIERVIDSHTYPSQIEGVVHKVVDFVNGSAVLAEGSNQLAQGSVNLAGGSVQLANGALTLAAGSKLLASSSASALFAASSSLATASDSLSDVTSLDEDRLGDYIYAPVKLDKNNLYVADEYGSEVAAFYIVLSMWVGGVITSVLIKPGQATGTKYNPIEVYFGKFALFLVLALLQTTVTLIGTLFLGIEISNFPVFTFSTYLISIVFMFITYSLVSALGYVGKGVNVVWLVLQLQSTGGIYPIKLMNTFFQNIAPFMPMTYAIRMLREASRGLLWANYTPALIMLIAIAIITLVLGVILKSFADDKTHWFEEKLKEVDLFE